MTSSLATTGPHVRIRTTPDQQQLPDWLRARLRLGARRVERLRQDIAAQAGLPTLPPAEIFPEVWRVNGELVLGRTGVVERDGELHLGALLPAASVVQSDDGLLHKVVLLQVWCCLSRMVHAATQDRALHALTAFVDPAVWFGPEDVARLRNWKDHKILGMEVLADLLAKSLPTVAPPPDDVGQGLCIPDWVLARLDSSVERASTAPGGRP